MSLSFIDVSKKNKIKFGLNIEVFFSWIWHRGELSSCQRSFWGAETGLNIPVWKGRLVVGLQDKESPANFKLSNAVAIWSQLVITLL